MGTDGPTVPQRPSNVCGRHCPGLSTPDLGETYGNFLPLKNRPRRKKACSSTSNNYIAVRFGERDREAILHRVEARRPTGRRELTLVITVP